MTPEPERRGPVSLWPTLAAGLAMVGVYVSGYLHLGFLHIDPVVQHRKPRECFRVFDSGLLARAFIPLAECEASLCHRTVHLGSVDEGCYVARP